MPVGFKVFKVFTLLVCVTFFLYIMLHLKSFNALSVLAGIKIEQCMKIKWMERVFKTAGG